MKVAEKMTTNVVTLNVTATAADATKKMQSENVGTVLVVEGGLSLEQVHHFMNDYILEVPQ